MVSTRLMTAEDLERLPDDGSRYELVRGDLIRMAPTSFEHFEVTGLVSYYLNAHVIPRKLGVVGGEGGFVLHRGPDTVRAPDVAFVRAERVPSGEAAKHFAQIAPDLAVEIRSSNDSMRDLLAKADEYLAAGTSLVWIFDPPTTTVIVKAKDGTTRTLGIDDELDGGDVLPDFRLPLRLIYTKTKP
jgi:Uma2 family endonuclease